MYRTLALLFMILLASFTRVIPHPPNFSPIIAMSLFGAAYFKDRWIALLAPILMMSVSDLALEFFTRWDLVSGWMIAGQGLHSGWWVVYITMLLVTFLGMTLRSKLNLIRLSVVTISGSLLFFTVTNFFVWVSGGGYGYTKDFTGLLECYVMALPFLQWSLMGNVFFVTALFGSFVLLENKVFKTSLVYVT